MIQVPVFKNTWQIVEACEVHDRERTSIALSLFYQNYQKKFSDPMGVIANSLNNLVVEWSSKEKSIDGGYSMDGKRLANKKKIIGLTRTPTMIWIYTEHGERICQTSLVHELVHVALWATHGSGDPDHLGKKYEGWTIDHTAFIQELNETLCILGL